MKNLKISLEKTDYNNVKFPCIGKSIAGLNPESSKGYIEVWNDKYSPFDNGWNWEFYNIVLTTKKGKVLELK